MSCRSADVLTSRASTWRDAIEYNQPTSSRSATPPSTLQLPDGVRLARRRSIGPVWPQQRDRELSALFDPTLAEEDVGPKRRQTEAIPIPESLDASGLRRSQAWAFEASYDARQERVRRRLQKAQAPTEQYAIECRNAGMGPCQYGWRMGWEHTGDCPRPALPNGAFCSWHTCTSMIHDGERCPNFVARPDKFRICTTGYHLENNQWPHLDQAIARNQAILAKEAQEAPERDQQHLVRYAQITGETESKDGYSIYTQLNGTRKRQEVSRKPSALDLSITSRRPSFSEQPTPLPTSYSTHSSADSSKLRTPVTPLPARDWPLYTLDAALLKKQLDNACSTSQNVHVELESSVPVDSLGLQPAPRIVTSTAPVVPIVKKEAGLSIEIMPVTNYPGESPISPSPSSLQLRRTSLSPVSAKPALPTVDESEEGHSTPARSLSPRPLLSSSPLPISSRNPSSSRLTVEQANSPASAYFSASPCSASSQLQIVLGQAKRTPATSLSIRSGLTSASAASSRRSSTSSQQLSVNSRTGSAVEVVMPCLHLAKVDEVLTVKERIAARKAETDAAKPKIQAGGQKMAKMMRGRMGDGFMHRSAWGRTHQMDEDLLALQAAQ